jgi:penicillin-binding protein 1A
LPIWDKFMTRVYQHPETSYRKGSFKQPDSLGIVLECDQHPPDSSSFDTDFE